MGHAVSPASSSASWLRSTFSCALFAASVKCTNANAHEMAVARARKATRQKSNATGVDVICVIRNRHRVRRSVDNVWVRRLNLLSVALMRSLNLSLDVSMKQRIANET